MVEGHTCAKCIFYLKDNKVQGSCHKSPPNLIFLGMNPKNSPPTPIRFSMWPEVMNDAWCGEFKPQQQAS